MDQNFDLCMDRVVEQKWIHQLTSIEPPCWIFADQCILTVEKSECGWGNNVFCFCFSGFFLFNQQVKGGESMGCLSGVCVSQQIFSYTVHPESIHSA